MTTIDNARRLELLPAPAQGARRIDRAAAERAVADLLVENTQSSALEKAHIERAAAA
jgi:hypothetical protein